MRIKFVITKCSVFSLSILFYCSILFFSITLVSILFFLLSLVVALSQQHLGLLSSDVVSLDVDQPVQEQTIFQMLVLPAEARTFWNVKITKRSLRRLASELGCICNGNYEHVEILYILHVSNWKTTFLCQISIFLNNSILTWSASSDPPFLDSFNPQARDERWPILFLLSGVFLFFLLSGVFFSCATWDFFLLPHGTFFLGHPHPRRWLLQKWLVLAVALMMTSCFACVINRWKY